MPPETRLAAVLFGSFLLWLPALTAFLRGDLDAGSVGVRFAGAVVVVWAAIVLVSSIVSGYRPEPVHAGEHGGEQEGRRADDTTPGPRPPAEAPPAEDLPATSVSDASDG